MQMIIVSHDAGHDLKMYFSTWANSPVSKFM